MDYSVGPISRDKGFKERRWAVLGQTYVPLHVTEHSASLHATMPPGTFVPMHLHHGQDEMLFLIEGVPHAFYNKSDRDAVVLVTVSPPRQFFELMDSISGVPEPAEVGRLGGEHNVPFL